MGIISYRQLAYRINYHNQTNKALYYTFLAYCTFFICLDADSERTPLLSSKSFSKSDNSSEESTRSIFRSLSTQKKLTLLCLGISNVFGYMALGVMSPVFPQMVKHLMEIFQGG